MPIVPKMKITNWEAYRLAGWKAWRLEAVKMEDQMVRRLDLVKSLNR